MITKRQLGLILAGLGGTAVLLILAVDVLGAGEFQGIGPAQRVALALAGVVLVLGLSLIPLGNRPA